MHSHLLENSLDYDDDGDDIINEWQNEENGNARLNDTAFNFTKIEFLSHGWRADLIFEIRMGLLLYSRLHWLNSPVEVIILVEAPETCNNLNLVGSGCNNSNSKSRNVVPHAIFSVLSSPWR